MPANIAEGACDITNDLVDNQKNQAEKYLISDWGQGVMEYEEYLGFDSVRRVHFVLPFRRFSEVFLEETESMFRKKDIFGRTVCHNKKSGLDIEEAPVIETREDWIRLKEHVRMVL